MHDNLAVWQLNGMRLTAVKKFAVRVNIFNGRNIFQFIFLVRPPALNICFAPVVERIILAEPAANVEKRTIRKRTGTMRRGNRRTAHCAESISAVLTNAISRTNIPLLHVHFFNHAKVSFAEIPPHIGRPFVVSVLRRIPAPLRGNRIVERRQNRASVSEIHKPAVAVVQRRIHHHGGSRPGFSLIAAIADNPLAERANMLEAEARGDHRQRTVCKPRHRRPAEVTENAVWIRADHSLFARVQMHHRFSPPSFFGVLFPFWGTENKPSILSDCIK